jgi:hypothetical protein
MQIFINKCLFASSSFWPFRYSERRDTCIMEMVIYYNVMHQMAFIELNYEPYNDSNDIL